VERGRLTGAARGEAQVAREHGVGYDAAEEEQQNPPSERGGVHRGEAQLAEPEPVGGEAQEPRDDDEHQEEQRREGEDDPAERGWNRGVHSAPVSTVEGDGHGTTTWHIFGRRTI